MWTSKKPPEQRRWNQAILICAKSGILTLFEKQNNRKYISQKTTSIRCGSWHMFVQVMFIFTVEVLPPLLQLMPKAHSLKVFKIL